MILGNKFKHALPPNTWKIISGWAVIIGIFLGCANLFRLPHNITVQGYVVLFICLVGVLISNAVFDRIKLHTEIKKKEVNISGLNEQIDSDNVLIDELKNSQAVTSAYLEYTLTQLTPEQMAKIQAGFNLISTIKGAESSENSQNN